MAEIVSSYGIEIRHVNRIFYNTITLFNKAISFCIEAFDKEWDELKTLDTLKQKNMAEHLVHGTKNNVAKYSEFDVLFYKMPSYLRRSAISYALGALSSYHSNLANWEQTDKITTRPKLQKDMNKLPAFYRDNMYEGDGSDEVSLKLYVDNDWKWVNFTLKHTDMQYIRKHCHMSQMTCPVLEKVHHKWFLRFAFKDTYKLSKKKYDMQTILAVDLGINTDAVCSVMRSDGTVLARKFINFASEKDLIYHTLGKIKKVSKKSGSHNTTKLWRYVTMHNEELARKIAKAIADYAVSMNCDIIVFEHLDTNGKKRGAKKQRLHMWRKNTIQKIVEHKAHKNNIRISRICAWNTSKLAYDGSGEVLRGKEGGLSNNKLCKFSNGKIYNCDLSASYNIGARYFIREMEKTISAKRWSQIQAKVPDCEKRTWCTYATLLMINGAA